MDKPSPPVGATRVGFSGAGVAAAAWVFFVLLHPDPQAGIGLLLTPFVAAPLGFATMLVWLARAPGRVGERVMLVLFALMVASLPMAWIVAEVLQMYGWD